MCSLEKLRTGPTTHIARTDYITSLNSPKVYLPNTTESCSKGHSNGRSGSEPQQQNLAFCVTSLSVAQTSAPETEGTDHIEISPILVENTCNNVFKNKQDVYIYITQTGRKHKQQYLK